jgi:transcriptional regulator with XRE-family HTH domain
MVNFSHELSVLYLSKGNEKVKKQDTVRAPWVAGESVKVWLQRVSCLQSKKDVIAFFKAFAKTPKGKSVSRNTIKKYLDEDHYAIERENILSALENYKYTSKNNGGSCQIGRYGYEPIDKYTALLKDKTKAKDNTEARARLNKIAEQRKTDYWNIIEHQCKKVGTQCDNCGGVYLRSIKNKKVENYRIIKDMSPIASLKISERLRLAKIGLKGISPPSGAEGPPFFGATIYLSAHVDKQFGSINANKSNHFEVEKTLCEYCLGKLCDSINTPVSDALYQIKKSRNWTMSELGSALGVSQSSVSRLMRRVGEAPHIKFIKHETLNRLLDIYSKTEQHERELYNEKIRQQQKRLLDQEEAIKEHDIAFKKDLKDMKESVKYLRNHFWANGYDIQVEAEEITTIIKRKYFEQKGQFRKVFTSLPDKMFHSVDEDKIAVFLNEDPKDIYTIISIAKKLDATHIWYKHYKKAFNDEDYSFIYHTDSKEEKDSKLSKHVCLDLSFFPPVFCETPINLHTFLRFRTNEEIKSKKYKELDKAINKTMHYMASSKLPNCLQEHKIQLDIEKIQLLKKNSWRDSHDYFAPHDEDLYIPFPFIEDLQGQTVNILRKMTKPSEDEAGSMLRFLETISQQQPQRWSPKTSGEYLFQFPPRDILQWNFQVEIYKHLEQYPEQEYVDSLAKEYGVDCDMIFPLLYRHSKLAAAIYE